MSRRLALPLAVVLGALAVILGVSQIVIPEVVEDDIAERLTEGGGSAEASVEALPAARLLFGEGDRIEVRGSELDLELTQDTEVFSRLDGFDEVDVALDEFRAGPFEVAGFALTRDGPGPYSLRASASTSGSDLLEYSASELGIDGAPLLGFFAGEAAAEADRRIPIDLDMELESEGGRVIVVSGGGTVAGFPTGPLAEVITSAIVVRL
jgi:hypothetical protein